MTSTGRNDDGSAVQRKIQIRAEQIRLRENLVGIDGSSTSEVMEIIRKPNDRSPDDRDSDWIVLQTRRAVGSHIFDGFSAFSAAEIIEIVLGDSNA
jgi:hypothetical protein